MPWIAGTKLVVKRGMTGATGNIYAGLHEFADMSFLLHFLRPNDLFVDVGANVGSYTVLASGVCKARSISFEPAPETSVHLKINVKANALENLVVVHEVVIGAKADTVPFTVGLDSTNQVAKPEDQNVRLLRQVCLDDILACENPNLIKVDVEGYEEEVLKGAEGTLSNKSLVAIELETVSEFIEEILKKHGFARMHYDPFRRQLTEKATEFPASNALFIRNAAFVRDRVRSADKVHILDSLI